MARFIRNLFVIFTALIALGLFTPRMNETLIKAENSTGSLLLNEICPWPDGNPVYVELCNPGTESVSTSGWSIDLLSGDSFTLGEDQNIPPNGIVLIVNDENVTVSDFKSDGSVILITGVKINPVKDGDGIVLTGPDGPVDMITWGNPSISFGYALPAGDPLMPPDEVYTPGEEIYRPGDVLIRVPSTWPPHTEKTVGSQNWVYRHSDSASPGGPNPIPAPYSMFPEDGNVFASDFALRVTDFDWSDGITFRIARDPAFTDIVLEETTDEDYLFLEDFPAGTYYWQVRGNKNGYGDWRRAQSFTREPFNIDDYISSNNPNGTQKHIKPGKPGNLRKGGGTPPDLVFGDSHEIGVQQIQQHKDTFMVCLDGCDMNGSFAWDMMHPLGLMTGNHNDKYCVRA
ncbi:MAG: lamin tail domain-containing protein [bacterium]